ncbi:MAG: hypothetical protein DRJ28_08850 [Actinobacteria bacterium]|nr:MAG: hypothetical protein DRJ28_08850 [Actinomycetota bacterium]
MLRIGCEDLGICIDRLAGPAKQGSSHQGGALRVAGSNLVESNGDLCTRDGAVRRTLVAGVILAIAVAACGGSMTTAAYVESLNALVASGRSDLEAAVVAHGQIAEPTLAESFAFVEREVAIRQEFLAGFEALDPPNSIAEVHRVLADAMARLLAAAEGLVAGAGTVASLEEAEQTPEFAEYRAANADGSSVCLEVQAKLDDLVAGGEAFADAPWIPNELSLAVRAALGCGEVATG